MSLRLSLLCLLAGALFLRAQEYEIDQAQLGAAVEAINEWALTNVDDDVLQALRDVDRERVVQFLDGFQESLQGSNVLKLAGLRAAATNIIPILDNYEETYPYAAWLRSRLDYFEVADELNHAKPKGPPGMAPPLPTVPTITVERRIWTRKLADRPMPKGAEKLVPRLKPIFSAQRVPPELVWIAEVESSFDANARSPAGAAGLFQLMPQTAKAQGLRRWPFDQRYQPEPSARAAARYLDALHKRFGDWPLTLAAYNAGEGRVQRLLEKNKAKTFDQIASKLPAETQLYVPKVEAALLRREGVKLTELKRPPD